MSKISVHWPDPVRQSENDWDTINSTQLYRLYATPPRVTAPNDGEPAKKNSASVVKVLTSSKRK